MKWQWRKVTDAIQLDLLTVKEAVLDVAGAVEAIPAAVDPRPDLDGIRDRLDQTELSLDGIEGRIKDLTLAIGEGIERTTRAENRVKATITRARKEFASNGLLDPGLEAEAAELRVQDGDGGEDSDVQQLRLHMDEPREADAEERRERELVANLRLRGLG